MTKYWMALPPQIRAALISAALIIIGSAAEVATAWLQHLGNAAPV